MGWEGQLKNAETFFFLLGGFLFLFFEFECERYLVVDMAAS